MERSLRLSGLLLFLCAMAGESPAQQFLWELDGDASTVRFGYRVVPVGDVDADGADDFVVTDPYYAPPKTAVTGQFFLYSGATRQALWNVIGANPGSYMGEDACALGDLDGDGHPEFAVGDEHGGEVTVYSAIRQTALYSLQNLGAYSRLFYSIANTGDVDADGVSDLIIAGFGRNTYLYSGATATLIHEWSSDRSMTCSAAGDVNLDGVPDLVIGYPDMDSGPYVGTGEVHIISGSDWSTIRSINGRDLGLISSAGLGSAVKGGHDIDADGVPDVIIGMAAGNQPNRVYAWSGATGNIIASWSSGSSNTGSISFSSDLDRDGVTDIVFDDGADSHVVSGRTWQDFFSISGQRGAPAVADVDANGVADVLIGDAVLRSSGAVVAYQGAPLPTVSDVQPQRIGYRDSPTLTISGAGFSHGVNPAVFIGTDAASNVSVVDDGTITASIGPGAPGVYDVTVQDSIGSGVLPQSLIRVPAIALDGDFHIGGHVTVRYLIDPNDGIFAVAGFPPLVSIPTPPFDGDLSIFPFVPVSFTAPGILGSDEFDLDGDLPNDPSLVGTQILFQAIIGPVFSGRGKDATWTNLATLTVR